MNRAARRAFTLIELLVVMAIMATLVGILLPSLATARRQAKQIVCRNNLRSLFTGVLMYAQDHRDHVPYIETFVPNDDDPDGNDDPFHPDHPTAVGNVLGPYVNPDSWVCPSAVAGYPRAAGAGSWTLTYSFRTAGPAGSAVPYDGDPAAETMGIFDPAITNYRQFDGRPLRLLNGRRYVSFGVSGEPVDHYNYERRYNLYWATRWPLIWDTMAGEPLDGRPFYTHLGSPDPRADLGEAAAQYRTNTNHSTAGSAYMALFADGDRVDILLTREPQPHQSGF